MEPCDYAVINLGTVSNFPFFFSPFFLQALNKQTSMCNVFDKEKRKKKEKSIILSKSKGFIMQIGNRVYSKHDSHEKFSTSRR